MFYDIASYFDSVYRRLEAAWLLVSQISAMRVIRVYSCSPGDATLAQEVIAIREGRLTTVYHDFSREEMDEIIAY